MSKHHVISARVGGLHACIYTSTRARSLDRELVHVNMLVFTYAHAFAREFECTDSIDVIMINMCTCPHDRSRYQISNAHACAKTSHACGFKSRKARMGVSLLCVACFKHMRHVQQRVCAYACHALYILSKCHPCLIRLAIVRAKKRASSQKRTISLCPSSTPGGRSVVVVPLFYLLFKGDLSCAFGIECPHVGPSAWCHVVF